ncbi:protein of unknown function [Lachnospiraceae bacterium C10]|nr:protein of unknown function [Lachnospiraceae bacterium C10]
MHSYLRSIGLRGIQQQDLEEIYKKVKEQPDKVDQAVDSNGFSYVELRKEYLDGMGIAFRGTLDKNGEFIAEYYFPYRIGSHLSTNESVEVVRHSEKESLEGICEEYRLGTDLIFFVEDMFKVLKSDQRKNKHVNFGGVTISSLALEGKILLPAKKRKPKKPRNGKKVKTRGELMRDSKRGDGKAFEQLALTEMDIYSKITKRVMKREDIYSIVESSFIPSGIEIDKYQVLAEILEVSLVKNAYTAQELYVMTLDCSGFVFEMCINREDLYGEPLPGRRFKGEVWLQGSVCNTKLSNI